MANLDIRGSLRNATLLKALVVGRFSFEEGQATANDLRARDVVRCWLDLAGFSHDCATVPPFGDGVDWRRVDPTAYASVIFVCGPFGKRRYEAEFLSRFAASTIFGVDLSMLERLKEWNPFDVLLERANNQMARPDIMFDAETCLMPVVGICLEPYEGGEIEAASAVVRRVAASREMALIGIDTRLDRNSSGQRTPAEVESLIARMDALVTTRIHGLVFALKNGVPAVAIDVGPGEAKLLRQARTLGWPVVFTIGSLSNEALDQALMFCLTDEARRKARECGELAAKCVGRFRSEFDTAVAKTPQDSSLSRMYSEIAAEHSRGTQRAKISSDDLIPSVASQRRGLGIAKRVFHSGLRRRIRNKLNRPLPLHWGGMRRLKPVARDFFDRGLPVDRYYIERFLAKWRNDIHGAVLEIADASYTRRFGGSRVTRSDVLHVAPGNPRATIVGDLATGKNIPIERYDCLILTQTLLCIYDVDAAIRHAHRALKPGGVLLMTVPGISQICRSDYETWGDYWRFTTLSVSRLLSDVFGDVGEIQVVSHGNVLMALAFLHNLATHEFLRDELDFHDPDYQLLITARAVKAGRAE